MEECVCCVCIKESCFVSLFKIIPNVTQKWSSLQTTSMFTNCDKGTDIKFDMWHLVQALLLSILTVLSAAIYFLCFVASSFTSNLFDWYHSG